MTLPPFQRLVDDHWRDVARLARALAGPVDGDDVAQQAWTQAYAAYPRLTSARHLRGWLLTITHRCAMDIHRSRGRRAVPARTVSSSVGTALRPRERCRSMAQRWVMVSSHPRRFRVEVRPG